MEEISQLKKKNSNLKEILNYGLHTEFEDNSELISH